MKKTLKLAILLSFFITVNPASAQTVDSEIDGPVLGFTYLTRSLFPFFSANLHFYSAKTLFDEDGETINLNAGIPEDLADPEIRVRALNFHSSVYLMEKLNLSFAIPVFFSQGLLLNSSSVNAGNDYVLEGLTGLGDINLGLNYLIYGSSLVRVLGTGKIYLPTGSSPEQVKEDNFGSTGRGHRAYVFGISSDALISDHTIVSVRGQYILQEEAEFSYKDFSWKQKDGNIISVDGAFNINVKHKFSINFGVNYSRADKIRINGKEIKNTSTSSFSLRPGIGVQLSKNNQNAVNFRIGYEITLFGVNEFKYSGFVIGLDFLKLNVD